MLSRAVPVVTLVLLALAGCTPDVEPPTTAAPSPAASATPTSSPSPSTAPPPVAEQPIPLAIACEELVTAQQFYDFNSNYSPTPGGPESGSLAQAAVDAGGTSCRWANQSSGETIDVAVAHLPPNAFAEREAAGAFADGTAQAFGDGYWVVAVSGSFVEQADAQPLLDAALAAVR